MRQKQVSANRVKPDKRAITLIRTHWKALLAAEAFAIGALLVWEFWLNQIWEALALPKLHHYWYGIFLMLGAFLIHQRKDNKKWKYALFAVGITWFLSDFHDFIANIASIL